jgi:hypothetical protein
VVSALAIQCNAYLKKIKEVEVANIFTVVSSVKKAIIITFFREELLSLWDFQLCMEKVEFINIPKNMIVQYSMYLTINDNNGNNDDLSFFFIS